MDNESYVGASHPISRLSFLKYSGMSVAATTLFIAGCKEDVMPDPIGGSGVDLGSGDIGILNYAYALEQLEAAFYAAVIASPYTGMTAEENEIFTDLAAHELAHKDFLKTVLGVSAIQDLEVDFSSIDFSARYSVLSTAILFEDLGVSAYNGAGKLLDSADYLLVAGKIVSVEARHAAAVRDLLNPLSANFAGDDIVDASGLDISRSPEEVIVIAGIYLITQIDGSNLPTE